MWRISETMSRRENVSSQGKQKVTNGIKMAWLAKPPKTGGKLRMFFEEFKFYCENSSLAGCKYITETRRSWFERVIWIILHLTMIFIMGIIVWDVLKDYKRSPVVVVIDSDQYPSNLLDFPGVSVCNINRISRKAVSSLAQRIRLSNITKLSYEQISRLLAELGNLYDSSFDMHPQNKEFDVDGIFKKFYDGDYEPTEIMRELSPQCSNVIVKCRFRGESRNCSELFYLRKTQDGYCCTFNYAREVDDILGSNLVNPQKDPFKIEKIGEYNGLTVLIEPFLNDYFFPILPVTGWKKYQRYDNQEVEFSSVRDLMARRSRRMPGYSTSWPKITIFNPGDYPDNTSGGVTDTLISPGTENFLELDAVSVFSEKSIRRIDKQDRGCIFNDEVKGLYDGSYTYSDCIVDCKVNDIFEICGCRPFYYPRRDSHRVCNTSDATCLHEFKSKWWSVQPNQINKAASENKEYRGSESWSLDCNRCYPTCDDVRYFLQTSSTNLEKKPNSFLKNVKIVDQSLVHIFFSKYGTTRLKQDVAYYWYELLSNIGGICGVFIGFSLISIVELVYFFVLSGTSLWASKPLPSKSDGVFVIQKKSIVKNEHSLYWNELVPQGKFKEIRLRYLE